MPSFRDVICLGVSGWYPVENLRQFFLMRAVSAALILPFLALPAFADIESGTGVEHRVDGRFGVSIIDGPNGTSGTQGLYEGRYTASFRHTADNGVRFRFDLGVAIGNFDSMDPPRYRPGRNPFETED